MYFFRIDQVCDICCIVGFDFWNIYFYLSSTTNPERFRVAKRLPVSEYNIRL